MARAMPALPQGSAAGNGDDLTATVARSSLATADDPGDATGTAPSVSAFIYGYDCAGDPTITDAVHFGISVGELPD